MRLLLLLVIPILAACGSTQQATAPDDEAPTLAELTATFRALDAEDPEEWALSQHEEGIPQLARFLLLREAWDGVVDEQDSRWIAQEIRFSQQEPDAPLTGAGRAIASMKAKGVTDEEITDLVRAMQYSALFNFLVALDNPPGDVVELPLARATRWGLFRIDPDTGAPIEEVGGLYESLLETDPTRREMRPRRVARPIDTPTLP